MARSFLLTSFGVLTVVAFLGVLPAYADITVDPDGIGATDVVDNPAVPILITNPVADPFAAAGDVAVGNTAVGALSITNGGDFSNENGYVGHDAGSEGTVIVDGSGSVWQNWGTLSVGLNGEGTVIIQNGGTVNSIPLLGGFLRSMLGDTAGATGSVTVDGAGSVWEDQTSRVDVGYRGTGTLTIQNGGSVVASGAVVVDPYNTSSKIVFDNGSLTAQAVFAAEPNLEGTGTIDAEGWCFDSDVVIAQASDLQYQLHLNSLPGQNITATIDLSSGAGRLGIGFDETASMTIQNGQTVLSNRGYIGYRVGSVGTATVDGPGSSWEDAGDYFFPGFQGTGTLLVQNGAEVSATGELGVGYYGIGALTISGGSTVSSGSSLAAGTVGSVSGASGSSGTVIVDGAGSTFNDSSSQFYVGWEGAGAITIQNGADSAMNQVFIAASAGSTGDATVDGTGSTWTIADYLLIGNSGDGSLTISDGGQVDVAGWTSLADEPGASGTLAFGIGDNGPGQLTMTGDLTIKDNTTLEVSVDTTTAPTVGQQYTVVTFDGSLTGTFTNEPTPTMAGDYIFDWNVIYNTNDIKVEVDTAALTGDFDQNGTVEGADLTAWEGGFGTADSATHAQGDADGDGDVDGVDFLSWQRQSGMTSGAAGAALSQAVPEPTTLGLFFAGLLGLGLAARRRSRCWPG